MTSEPVVFGNLVFSAIALVLALVISVLETTKGLLSRKIYVFLLLIIPSIYFFYVAQVFYYRHGWRGIDSAFSVSIIVNIYLYVFAMVIATVIYFFNKNSAYRFTQFALLLCLALDNLYFSLAYLS
jgi:hypothetical protein